MNNLLNHRNLPELLSFAPHYAKLTQDGDYIVVSLASRMDEATTNSMKLRFGFLAGIVTPTAIKIHKSYLAK